MGIYRGIVIGEIIEINRHVLFAAEDLPIYESELNFKDLKSGAQALDLWDCVTKSLSKSLKN